MKKKWQKFLTLLKPLFQKKQKPQVIDTVIEQQKESVVFSWNTYNIKDLTLIINETTFVKIKAKGFDKTTKRKYFINEGWYITLVRNVYNALFIRISKNNEEYPSEYYFLFNNELANCYTVGFKADSYNHFLNYKPKRKRTNGI